MLQVREGPQWQRGQRLRLTHLRLAPRRGQVQVQEGPRWRRGQHLYLAHLRLAPRREHRNQHQHRRMRLWPLPWLLHQHQ